MTNLEAIRDMNAEQLAALLYVGRQNLQGWAFPELIDWLNAHDNISSVVDENLIKHCWSNYGGICVSESVNG